MADTATKDRREATAPRDESIVESDMIIVQRHLRRKMQVQWSDAEPFKGEVRIGKFVWECELDYRKKYDVYRFRITREQDHTSQINRQFEVTSHNAYTLTNDVMAVVSTLRLIGTLDLEQD